MGLEIQICITQSQSQAKRPIPRLPLAGAVLLGGQRAGRRQEGWLAMDYRTDGESSQFELSKEECRC